MTRRVLLHEDLIWSLFPPHVGMRQYWRDFDSLESWTRSGPQSTEPVVSEIEYYSNESASAGPV
jgi:hypothetical protein